MSRRWRRSLERQRTRDDDDRSALEHRIALAVQEDAHAAGYHAVIPSRTCPRCGPRETTSQEMAQ